jgi:hypothetical protein
MIMRSNIEYEFLKNPFSPTLNFDHPQLSKRRNLKENAKKQNLEGKGELIALKSI